MPNRVYQPVRQPPTFIDRVLVHPWGNTIALFSAIIGLAVILTAFWDTRFPSVSLAYFPDWLAFIIGACATIGGFYALLGLHWVGENVSMGWAFEQLGWSFVLAAFLSYSSMVAWLFPLSFISWLTPIALSAGAGVRIISLAFIKRSTRRDVADIKRRAHHAHLDPGDVA